MIASILAWIGTISYILCMIPQAWQCWKQGHSNGVNLLFLTLYIIGGVTYSSYALLIWNMPIFTNNIIGLFFTFVVVWYRVFPRK